MGRKAKKHDERKQEILDAAWELFTSRGYEGTTVAAIIAALDISKGTFYHYFTSKEQVLNAIADQMSAEARTELEKVVEDRTLPALPKLNLFIEVARQTRLRRVDLLIPVARVLYQERNLMIRHKLTERSIERTGPMLTKIIEEGVEEGAFQVSDEHEAAAFFLSLSSIFGEAQMKTLLSDMDVRSKVAKMVRRAEFASQSLERMLGAPHGVLSRPSEEVIEMFVLAVDEQDRGCD